MSIEEYNQHIREMYRAMFEQNGIEAIIDNIIYWRDKSDSYLDGRQVKMLLEQNKLLRQKIMNIRKSAKEYKRGIDFTVAEQIHELKRLREPIHKKMEEIRDRLKISTKKSDRRE